MGLDVPVQYSTIFGFYIIRLGTVAYRTVPYATVSYRTISYRTVPYRIVALLERYITVIVR